MTLLGGDMAREKIAATLLLTLPGLPFVYYGEEIGMSGDKPDPRSSELLCSGAPATQRDSPPECRGKATSA